MEKLPNIGENYNAELASEEKENVLMTKIPENLTREDLILTIDKLQNGEKIGQGLVGKLLNGPIEVGKSIETTMAKSSDVVEIIQQGEKYLIKTQSGSEYLFDPSTSIPIPDYLRK